MRITQKQKNKKTILQKIIIKFIFCLIIICGISYVVSVNNLSIKGFVLADLKSKVSELQKENENIELKVMNLESYENITKRVNELKMVKVDKIDYITKANDFVAKR